MGLEVEEDTKKAKKKPAAKKASIKPPKKASKAKKAASKPAPKKPTGAAKKQPKPKVPKTNNDDKELAVVDGKDVDTSTGEILGDSKELTVHKGEVNIMEKGKDLKQEHPKELELITSEPVGDVKVGFTHTLNVGSPEEMEFFKYHVQVRVPYIHSEADADMNMEKAYNTGNAFARLKMQSIADSLEEPDETIKEGKKKKAKGKKAKAGKGSKKKQDKGKQGKKSKKSKK